MPRSTMFDVQSLLVPILRADLGLLSLLGPHPDSLITGAAVFDGVPEQFQVSKAVYYGESIETPDDTFGKYGRRELLTIHTVVEGTQDRTGWLLAKQINEQVMNILDGAELTFVTGIAGIFCHFQTSVAFRDPPWRHIATDFLIATEEV